MSSITSAMCSRPLLDLSSVICSTTPQTTITAHTPLYFGLLWICCIVCAVCSTLWYKSTTNRSRWSWDVTTHHTVPSCRQHDGRFQSSDNLGDCASLQTPTEHGIFHKTIIDQYYNKSMLLFYHFAVKWFICMFGFLRRLKACRAPRSRLRKNKKWSGRKQDKMNECTFIIVLQPKGWIATIHVYNIM